MEGEEHEMTKEEIQAKFATLAAEGDIHAQHGAFFEAIESYSKALYLKPDDKHCLVARSKCFINTGSPELSLDDANACLKVDPTFFKGIFQKAEALYSMGDFENALVFYHRGHNLRPELDEFRIGISKSREAIENSIGNPKDCKIHIPDHLRKKIGLLMGTPLKYDDDVNKSPLHKQKATKVAPSQAPVVSDRAIENVNNFLISRGIQTLIPSSLTSSMETKLLEEIYEDKVYLSNLLTDKDLMDRPNDAVLRLVSEGLNYLHGRAEFWGQQKPLYARPHHQIILHSPLLQKGKASHEKTKEPQKIRQNNKASNPKCRSAVSGKNEKSPLFPPIKAR